MQLSCALRFNREKWTTSAISEHAIGCSIVSLQVDCPRNTFIKKAVKGRSDSFVHFWAPDLRCLAPLSTFEAQLGDRRQQRQISEQGLAVVRGRLEVRRDPSLQRRDRSPQNCRLANHLLIGARGSIYVSERCPGLEATNWRAKQAIRPMLVNRKFGVIIEANVEHIPKVFRSAFFQFAVSNSAPFFFKS
jgi:hypothetical protein